jgi:hypothetical protein
MSFKRIVIMSALLSVAYSYSKDDQDILVNEYELYDDGFFDAIDNKKPTKHDHDDAEYRDGYKQGRKQLDYIPVF